MTGYEIFGIVLAAIFTGSLLYLMWRIAKTVR
jgi:hypothetical protein